MNLFSNLITAISSYGTAIEFVLKNKMKRYFLWPVVLNILFFTTGFHFLGELSDQLLVWAESLIDFDSWEFWGSEFLSKTIHFFLWIILKVLVFLILAFLGGHVVLILMSPILAVVSEKTERILEGNDYPFTLKQLLIDILRGIRISVRNFAFEVLFIVLLFGLSFVPLLGLGTSPILVLVSAYYYGFSFIDYNLERKKYSVSDSVNYMKKNRGIVMGNGIIFALVLAIPFIGIALSSFVAIISAVAATISLHKKNQKERTNSSLTA
tara:strand:+ start:16638 stop:17438 length:801 start_codon:yes stop_codon:yes gene_type:complete